ncbi:MAG TPA: DNA polymerase III subunit gamma/tau [Alphaproteobacteria bacterium]|nr:DNA polymerase III subunit gamma/tau [Alphaproteobacteria bacterium]
MGNGDNNDYIVLARKYRPQRFEELVGQDALVRTLTNAIKVNRLHHAYVLTGIRGVGKTTTARIIAKALNCENGPSTTWDENDPQVKAITTGTHGDVLEYDAASNRSVEDVEKLFEGVNYAPMTGRYKVYIIDEVHMLSAHAFNALLKTLEEPPARVVFVFATTEVDKIPVTVLSRCMRFDLKRVPSEVLIRHFTNILEKESIAAEPAAINMIAQAADGSVRDGLSLLDQAIALSHGETIGAALVQDMLGLADRAKLYDLLGLMLGGSAKDALTMLDDLHARGQDALMVVQGLLDVVHMLTRLLLLPHLKDDMALDEMAKTRGAELAAKTTLASLSRVYQLLFTAAAEVKAAERPYEALSMATVRVAYLAPLPPLGELLEKVQGNTAVPAPAKIAEAPVPMVVPVHEVEAGNSVGARAVVEAPAEEPIAAKPVVAVPADWAGLVKQLEGVKPSMAAALRAQVRCTGLEGTDLHVTIDRGLHDAKDLIRDLRAGLRDLTGENWNVVQDLREGVAAPTLREQNVAAGNARKEAAAAEPALKDILSSFPGAVIEGVQEGVM